MNLDAMASCAELTTEHAEAAARSLASMRALFMWASRVARPGDGAPKILMAIARLTRADWIEGTPYVEISGNDRETALNVFSDHGMGIRERVVPLARLRVPIDEFARAIRLAPQLIAPFHATTKGTSLILTPRDNDELDQAESIKIDEKSLHEQERTTAPPPPGGIDRESGVPDDKSGVHTHPTVRRMVAVKPEALRSGNDDDG